MGQTRSAGLLVTVPRRGVRRPGIKRILRALAASAARQEAVMAGRAEEAAARNVLLRRAWERGGA